MARKPSSRSGRQTPKDEAVEASDTPDSVAAGDLGGDTVLVGDERLGEDAVAPEPDPGERVTIEPGDTTSAEGDGDDPSQTEIVEAGEASETETPPAESATEEAAPVADKPAPAPVERVVERSGPGFGGLVIGGVIAAALGYAAAFFGGVPGNDTSALESGLAEAQATVDAQADTIAGLQEQVATLAAVEPPVVPEVDLSGIEGAVAAQGEELSNLTGLVETLVPRIAALEDRPIFSGEVAEDSAAMAAAVEALEARLGEERAAAADALAEAEAVQSAAAAEVQAAAAAAQAAIAEAQARAQETADATQTQAALARVRIAMASGDPFSDALAGLNVEVPDALSAAAETGVPTLEELQATFPDAARAALPIALQETAGDTAGDRIGAFLMGQIGGRSVEPREGTDPDAVLSRAEAAAAAGDLDAALAEIETLPNGARTVLEDWVAAAETRAAADAALADLAATLDN